MGSARETLSGFARADRIFTGGTIVTVDGVAGVAEAVAVRAGVILAVGDREAVMRHRGWSTEIIDLRGATMVPGFIDTHSHLADYGMLWGLTALNAPPVSDVRTIEDVVRKMRRTIEGRGLRAGEAVFGNGYDEALLAEMRHPTRQELDRISTVHPVVLLHVSGRLAAANTFALERVGAMTSTSSLTTAARSRTGRGEPVRRDESGTPTGVVEGQAVFDLLRLLPPKSLEEQRETLLEIQRYYASKGITTAQDGQTLPPAVDLLCTAAAAGELLIDIVSYPKWTVFEKVLSGESKLDAEAYPSGYASNNELFHRCGAPEPNAEPRISSGTKAVVGRYRDRLKFGGFKLVVDGSTHSKTAFLSEPYFKAPAGAPEPRKYRGRPLLTQDELDRWIDVAFADDVQVLVHCAGDAASDMMIAAVAAARTKYGPKDLRPIMVSAQTVRDDQLDRMKELGIAPTFSSVQTFYGGDRSIRETLGELRAFRSNPAASALRRGMIVGNHTEAPAIPPDLLMAMDCAVNRTSREGVVVGADERVSPLEALEAITIGAAWLLFEETTKGSIEPGKRADFAVLSANPLSVPTVSIKAIEVLQTIKDGRTIYDVDEIHRRQRPRMSVPAGEVPSPSLSPSRSPSLVPSARPSFHHDGDHDGELVASAGTYVPDAHARTNVTIGVEAERAK